jgi:TATA-binding protein-associated factor
LLVLGGRIPDSLSTTLSDLFPAGWDIISELHKLNHSPKLVALHEILEVCGMELMLQVLRLLLSLDNIGS